LRGQENGAKWKGGKGKRGRGSKTKRENKSNGGDKKIMRREETRRLGLPPEGTKRKRGEF